MHVCNYSKETETTKSCCKYELTAVRTNQLHLPSSLVRTYCIFMLLFVAYPPYVLLRRLQNKAKEKDVRQART